MSMKDYGVEMYSLCKSGLPDLEGYLPKHTYQALKRCIDETTACNTVRFRQTYINAGRTFSIDGKSNKAAALVQMYVEVQSLHAECEGCRERQNGPFLACVVFPGLYDGGCANHIYHRALRHCSLRFANATVQPAACSAREGAEPSAEADNDSLYRLTHGLPTRLTVTHGRDDNNHAEGLPHPQSRGLGARDDEGLLSRFASDAAVQQAPRAQRILQRTAHEAPAESPGRMLVDRRSVPVTPSLIARVTNRRRHQSNRKSVPTQPTCSNDTPAPAMSTSDQHGSGDEALRTEKQRNRFGVPRSPPRALAGADPGLPGVAVAGDEDVEDLEDQLEEVRLKRKLRALKKQSAGR